MPSHCWGDKDFDWDALNDSISYCMRFWKRWGRIGSHGKEKWGTFRDHPYFWDGGLHGLLYPGYVRIVNRFLYWKIDKYIIKPFTKYTGLHVLGFWYQRMVYNYAVQKMCAKHPHIVDELVSHLDGYRIIEPGIFGNVDGIEVHNRHWRPKDLEPRKKCFLTRILRRFL